MNEPLKNILKIQLCALTGFDYQNFVVELYLLNNMVKKALFQPDELKTSDDANDMIF